MMPTADQVARAIIAACRETGEPVPVETLGGNHQERWRHYVVHALHARFPSCAPSALGRMIGADSFVKPGYFYRSSLWHVLGQTPHARRGPVPWWSDEALDRVMRAIPPSEPPKIAIMPVIAAAAEQNAVARFAAFRRSMDGPAASKGRPAARSDYFQPLPPPVGSKSALRAALRAAVVNTAKLQVGEE